MHRQGKIYACIKIEVHATVQEFLSIMLQNLNYHFENIIYITIKGKYKCIQMYNMYKFLGLDFGSIIKRQFLVLNIHILSLLIKPWLHTGLCQTRANNFFKMHFKLNLWGSNTD